MAAQLDSRDFRRKTVETWRTENLIDYILKDLEKRVKKDKATKLSVFFTGLSAYLTEPTNLFLKGESGSGKTYNTVETLRYFPQEDIWFLGGLSPKALIHDYGVLLNKHGEPLDLTEKPAKPKKSHYKDDFGEFKEAEYQEALERYKEQLKSWSEEIRNSYTLIDLSHKILVFLESPEYNTFRMLFPILSHDTERIEYRFTDKTVKGQLRTSKVVIQGWPATIFLSTDRKYMEELATRSFTVTPEVSKEKIEEANVLTNLKASFPWQYNHKTEETKVIQDLVLSIKTQFINGETTVIVPFMNLHELFPKEIVRDMRDFQHFVQFLKTITALHFYQRPFTKIGEKRFLLSTVQDVKNALEIYMEIFETTRTGTEESILDFYHEIVKTKESWYLKELTAKYNENHEKKLSSDTIRKRLERLSEIGYVDIQKDDADKRLNIYTPLILEEEKLEIHRILENPIILKAKLENGFEEWQKNKGRTTPFYHYKNFSENTWGEHEITDVFSFISGEDILPLFSKEDLKPKTENKPENIGLLETQQISANSETQTEMLFGCPVCKRFNKPIFFSSEDDLKLHIRRLHGGYPVQQVNNEDEKSSNLNDLKTVHWSDQFYDRNQCCICGYRKLTSWQAEDFRGNKLWICEDCKQEWEKRRNNVD